MSTNRAKQPDLQVLLQINQLLKEIESEKELVIQLSNQAKSELSLQELKLAQLSELETAKYQTEAIQIASDQQLSSVKSQENIIRAALYKKVSKALEDYFEGDRFGKFVLKLLDYAKVEDKMYKLVADPVLAKKYQLSDFDNGETGKIEISNSYKTYTLDPVLVKAKLMEKILPAIIAKNQIREDT